MVQVDQLQIGDGIDHPHGTASDGQGDEQRRNVTTQRDDREHERDDEGGGEESWQRWAQPVDKKQHPGLFNVLCNNHKLKTKCKPFRVV